MTDAAASPPVLDHDAPSPPTFDALPLSPETRGALERMGYTHPTPVQRAVFEPATGGRDLVVQARTGTGKTTAFGLPIVEYAVRRSVKAVQVLCLCPTRELALQVSREVERLGEGRGVQLVAVYGGAPMGRQIDALAAGAQVVIGTPGRVLDHLRRGTLDPSAVRLLVLDEADEMLSMGFERELHAILDVLPKERQTLLFSATIPPDIERIARERLRSPEFITLSSDAVGALSVAHYVYFVTEDKLQTLLRVLEIEAPESAIIFCNTKAETEVVAQGLARRGYRADWLNGDLPQSEREAVMSATRAGQLRFLVATDVAARGIDISHLTHVINYDFPESAEAYVHRTGRTGRAGRTGTALSLVRAQDVGNLYYLRLTYQIRPIERQIPTALELKTREEADLVGSLVDATSAASVHPDDMSLARRLLTHDRAEHVIAALLRERLGERETAAATAAAARRARTTPVPELEPAGGPEGAAAGETPEGGPLRRPRRGREGRDGRDGFRGRGEGRGPRDEGRGPREVREATEGRPARDVAEPRPAREAAAESRPTPEARPTTEPGSAQAPSEGGPHGVREAVREGAESVRNVVRAATEGVRDAVRAATEGVREVVREAAEITREGGERIESVLSGRDAPAAREGGREAAPAAREGGRATPSSGPEGGRATPSSGREGGRETPFGGREGGRERRDGPRERREGPRERREGAGFEGRREGGGFEGGREGGPGSAREGGRARRERGVGFDAAAPAPAPAPLAPPAEPLAAAAPERATPGEGRRGATPPWEGGNVRPGSEPRRPRSRGRGANDEAGAPPVRYFTSDANGEPPAAAAPGDSASILLTWNPPEEEGDDRPLLASVASDEAEGDEGEATTEEGLDYAELFVDVGRRDGARPSDIQKVLRDRGGISRRETGRIRVRDKHAFVLVRRELLDRALEALQGSIIAGRTVKAQLARERPNDAQG
ncbi:MAG TPA: DEAD/DEAH box helicase [Polyangiaceae bacterium]|nr:DEAD/DEAH box helicase [Polyangiaceae bacterium]